MGYWMGSIVGLLAPLVDAVRRYALAGGKVHPPSSAGRLPS